MTSKELSNFVFTSKYARWIPEKKRRETWKEATERVRNMMLEKYKDCGIEDEINFAYDFMQKKKVLGSQRTLQFAGDAVLSKNVRSYNCSFTYIDRPRVFQEVFYTLLCGCGVGYSVQYHHVEKLPPFVKELPKETKTYIIPDNIEGWADSVGLLISSFLENAVVQFEFDYSQIRPKGSPLSSSSAGKAPGPEPLKRCHERILALLKELVSNGQDRLKPINAHDILCHIADAVISGGIRRAAMIALFSKDDEEMMTAKTGDWFSKNPQRARCNNSVILLRDSTTAEEFNGIFKYTKEFGEPGIVWVNNLEHGVNPCQPDFATVLTKNGIRQFRDVGIGDEIWSNEGWTKIINKQKTGEKDVYEYITTAGAFIGTDTHRIISYGKHVEVGQAEDIDIFSGPDIEPVSHIPEIVIDGIVLGDGSVHKASNNLVYLCIGQDDYDYLLDNDIKKLIIKARPGLSNTAYEVVTSITHSELPKTYYRRVPHRYLYGSKDVVVSFLRGLFTANGGISGDRVALKTSSFGMVKDIQLMLGSVGITSYFTTNRSKIVKFSNGEYRMKQSYDINITVDRNKFFNLIGFVQLYKNARLKEIIDNQKSFGRKKRTYDIIQKNHIGKFDVYSITVDNKSHTYWTNNCNVANCGEIGLFAYDENGNSGFEFCNLCTINVANVENEEDFLDRCKAAAIIGTLQAGFNSFPYLGEVTERIVKKEALLGVSLSGMMQRDEIAFCPKIQRKGVKVINKTNEELSKKIGINRAARLSCIKPDGNSAAVLGVSSGIHPNHAKRYIRRVQNNTTDTIYQYFKKCNPQATEKSVWDASGTDENILFPIEVPDGSKLKNMISAIQMLEMVKTTYDNWVKPGTNEELCASPGLTHNVSNTVTVLDNEWDDVAKYVYKNRYSLGGISFLSDKGDKDYPQAPYTTIYTSRELVKEYGEAAVWCSGLIELGLQCFNNNLWAACDFILSCDKNGLKKSLSSLSLESDHNNLEGLADEFSLASLMVNFYRKVVKFAKTYFEGNIQRLTYCLKDVANYKTYYDIKSTIKSVDYTQMVEEDDNTNFEQESACAGGACQI